MFSDVDPRSSKPVLPSALKRRDVEDPKGSRGTASAYLIFVILVAGTAAYLPSFFGAFQYDDLPSILANPTIRHLWPLSGPLSPPSGALTVSGRPVLNFSFALNYWLSGYRPWSYHLVNLAVHLAAALTLFGLLRRTWQNSDWAAATAATLWAVHPLTTESVTYIVQRAESLMGLFYLLTL